MGAYDELDKFQTEEGRKIVSAFVAAALADEQQPAEATGGEQVQDGAAGRVEAWADAWDANVGDEHIITAWLTRAGRLPDDDCPELTMPDLRAVLAERDALREQLAAATARAESATVLPKRWRALIAERDAAAARAEKAEATVAELRTNRDHCVAREITAKIEARVLRREIAELRDAMGADALQEGRSATLRAEDGVQASGSELEFGSGTAGLSEPEDGRVTSVWCWAPNPDGPLRCGLLRDHEPPHRRGERTWTDDTTEDDRG